MSLDRSYDLMYAYKKNLVLHEEESFFFSLSFYVYNKPLSWRNEANLTCIVIET